MVRVGVCSWSLHPASAAELVERVRATGADAVQLALDPLRTGAWPVAATVDALARADVAILSGMMGMRGEDYATPATIRATGGVRPDAHWRANLEAAGANARLARELGIALVSFHAGFLPKDSGDSERAVMLERLRAIADRFAEQGVAVALETGQETAETLASSLEELDRANVGVNFDPANVLLYDRGDPLEALALLAGRVRQVHVKDARRPTVPDTWGEEVPVGSGEVDWDAFFDVLRASDFGGDLMIEREAGERRVEEIRTARALVLRQLARTGPWSSTP